MGMKIELDRNSKINLKSLNALFGSAGIELHNHNVLTFVQI